MLLSVFRRPEHRDGYVPVDELAVDAHGPAEEVHPVNGEPAGLALTQAGSDPERDGYRHPLRQGRPDALNDLERGRPTWHRLALCGDGKTDFFSDKPDAIARVRQACAGCPVQPQCQHYGSEEPAGVWGGVAAFERAKGRRRAG